METIKLFFSRTPKNKAKSSDFSKFFREASSGQKKKVFLEVARKSSKEQLAVIEHARLAQ